MFSKFNLSFLRLFKVAKYVESVTLQALDEEDNFVRAVATILHSRQTFGHLTFDISETNESFAKTLEKLSAYQLSDSPTSRVPLLASMLDTRITNAALAKSTVMPVENEINGTCLNTSCGFTMRDKSPALRMKETYLDRLQEECERRRIHVPIPGRSFGKQDSGDDSSLDGHHSHQHDDHRNSTELAPSVPNRRAPSFPRRASVARKADIGEGLPEATATSSGGLSARARLLSMHNRAQMGPNGPNGSALRRPFPPTAGDRGPFHRLSSGAAGSSAANKRRTTGIKLLDFEELPATGLQAKKLRKGTHLIFMLMQLFVFHNVIYHFYGLISFKRLNFLLTKNNKKRSARRRSVNGRSVRGSGARPAITHDRLVFVS